MQKLGNIIEQSFGCEPTNDKRRVTCQEDYDRIVEEEKRWCENVRAEAKKTVKDDVIVAKVFNRRELDHDGVLQARNEIYNAEVERLNKLPKTKLSECQLAFVKPAQVRNLHEKQAVMWYQDALSKAAGLGTIFYQPTKEDKQEAERDKRYSLYKKSEINKSFWDKTEKNEIVDKMCEGIKTNQVVFLYGKAGVGKTYSSSLFLKTLIDENIGREPCRCMLTNFSKIMDAVRCSKSFTYEGVDPIEKMSSVDYLVIDDLGLENPDQNMMDALFYILSKRQQHKKETVFVSNFDMNEVLKRLSSRIDNKETVKAIRSRLFADCCCIEYKGEDRRRKAA